MNFETVFFTTNIDIVPHSKKIKDIAKIDPRFGTLYAAYKVSIFQYLRKVTVANLHEKLIIADVSVTIADTTAIINDGFFLKYFHAFFPKSTLSVLFLLILYSRFPHQ